MQLGLFHILGKGTHPRLRFYEDNLLVAGWFCCHFPWHHDFYDARDRIVPRIKEIVGNDYEEVLLAVERTMPKWDRIMMEELLKGLEEQYG